MGPDIYRGEPFGGLTYPTANGTAERVPANRHSNPHPSRPAASNNTHIIVSQCIAQAIKGLCFQLMHPGNAYV